MARTDKEKISELLTCIKHICEDTRERSGEDWVCGLCEWDGPSWMECPGFDKDDCFRMKESYVEKYLDGDDYTQWYRESYGDEGREGR